MFLFSALKRTGVRNVFVRQPWPAISNVRIIEAAYTPARIGGCSLLVQSIIKASTVEMRGGGERVNECTHSPSVSLQGPAHSSSLQHSSPSPTRTRLHAGPSWLCPCPWPCPCPCLCPCPCSDMLVVTKLKLTSLLKGRGEVCASVRQCAQRECGRVDGVVGTPR